MSTSNTDLADSLVQRGISASQAGASDEALALFREAAAAAPTSALALFLLGAELMQSGRVAEAEGFYANAVVLAPGFDIARYQLGLLQFTSGRAALALVTWEPLFRRPTEHPLQRAVHGFAALAQDQFETARRCFEEAMQLNRDNAPLNRDLQMLIERIDGVKPAAATAVADEQPDADGGHVLLANYMRQGTLH